MIFNFEFSIPANTSAATPKREFFEVCYGLIYRIEIQFPPGCAALAYQRILSGGHQIYPSNQGQFFHLDGMVVAFDDILLIVGQPFELIFEGYNLDETFPHTIYTRIGLADKDIYMARFLPSITWDKLIEALKQEKSLQQSAGAQSLQDLGEIFQ